MPQKIFSVGPNLWSTGAIFRWRWWTWMKIGATGKKDPSFSYGTSKFFSCVAESLAVCICDPFVLSLCHFGGQYYGDGPFSMASAFMAMRLPHWDHICCFGENFDNDSNFDRLLLHDREIAHIQRYLRGTPLNSINWHVIFFAQLLYTGTHPGESLNVKSLHDSWIKKGTRKLQLFCVAA